MSEKNTKPVAPRITVKPRNKRPILIATHL